VLSYGRMTWSIVKTLIFTIMAPGTVGVYISYCPRKPGAHAISALGWLGLPPAAVGVAAYLWCTVGTFRDGYPV
jgi:hypothetical protein